jgi:tetratricopeptide (TPR) repeat protein
MLTVTNRAAKSMCLFLAVVTLFAGCGQPGPRALLQGKRLLEQGKHAEAIEKLRHATVLLGGTNALSFNYLGLACQEAGQLSEAERAYQRALALNHDLTEVHYNLGCLWLEHNKLDQARTELTAYTLRRGNSADGWLKLGAVQLRSSESLAGESRSRELGLAEKSFNEALHLRAQDPEALTGLGVARLRRGRAAEAAQCFKNVLKDHPGYAPALLNLAIVAQANLGDRQLALEKYRAYAALKPAPENVEGVKALIHQLELEINPSQTALANTGAPDATSSASKLSASDPARGNAPPKAGTSGFTAQPAQTSRVSATTTLAESLQKPEVSGSSTKQTPLLATQRFAPSVAGSGSPPAAVEHVTVNPEPVFKPAQDVSSAPAAPPATGNDALITAPPVPPNTAPAKPARHGLLHALNPATLFEHDQPQPATNRLTPLPSPAAAAQADSAAAGVLTGRRYAYRNQGRLPSGNRPDAERALAQAAQAHQAQRLPEAVQAYRQATQLDPSCYDAWFNLGGAATESGNVNLALSSYESALNVKPDSLDARYKFALALKQDNYCLDAANELEKILGAFPNESRAHLALGNLCAQQLHQPARARQHYLKVLENDPRNPQAANIRYWLMDNP